MAGEGSAFLATGGADAEIHIYRNASKEEAEKAAEEHQLKGLSPSLV